MKAFIPSPERADKHILPRKTLREVAEIMGISKERVRQVENRALAKFAVGLKKACEDLLPLIDSEK